MWSIICACPCSLTLERSKEFITGGTPLFQYKSFLIPTIAKCGKMKTMASLTASSPKREADPKKRIVITGMGIVSVFGNDIDIYYDKLLDGVSGITSIDRFDTSDYTVKIAGQIRGFSSDGYIDRKIDPLIDDCWRYSLVSTKRALEDANLGEQVLESMDKTKMGVLVGSGIGGITKSFGDGGLCKKMSPFFMPTIIANLGSALLAIDTGFMGPNYAISTACSTSNHCFFAAANHIRRGDADVMVAGGTDAAITPLGVGGLAACGALSKRNDQPEKASRPWNKSRDGFVIGEGAGALIMESLDHAMRRGSKIYAEYLGGAITCDAYHITHPHPSGLGVSSCMIKGLEDARVAPEEVNYVNAHATATIVGDLPEVNAIKKVFKDTSEMKMNATKSLIGHGIGAAGVLEAIATIKAINTGWLHPTINQYELEPDVTIDTVPNVKKRHQINVAMSNSFGFGGNNSVAIFKSFKP